MRVRGRDRVRGKRESRGELRERVGDVDRRSAWSGDEIGETEKANGTAEGKS